jgi:hypothetical protein
VTAVELYSHQEKALGELHNGAILRGGVGSGKSLVSIAYYFTRVCGGEIRNHGRGSWGPFKTPKDLYIITTAKKRDSLDWQRELAKFGLGRDASVSFGNTHIVIDSWNNIVNYEKVKDAFFIFDEQRLVGNGAWVKAFIKIAKWNQWILLSATPGDNWMDYIPVFVANGFYKNRTDFIRRHVVYNTFTKFPKVDHYVEIKLLETLRDKVLVEMPYARRTKHHTTNYIVEYDRAMYKRVVEERWHVYKDRPIREVAEWFSVMRRVVNSDLSRLAAIMKLMEKHPRLIIFYNFNYELEMLRTLGTTLSITVAEWNGHIHQDVPTTDKWLYLVQYTAGAEGWECITTDAIAFWSMNYSYKIMHQAKGRIDRMNTPYIDLYYYILRSNSSIDNAIAKALALKKKFNEKEFAWTLEQQNLAEAA